MRSSQLRKTVNRNRNRNRNKRKTWRNKRTKNARGGKLIKSGNQEWEQDDDTKDILNAYVLINGNKLPIFDGKMNEKGDGRGKLYRYASNGKMISMYEGFITGKKKQGRGKYETYDSNGKLDSMYDGEWNDDKKNGYGVYQKRYTYSGEWKNDEKYGKGVESGPVWSGDDQIGTIRTDGNWVNNKAVNGTMTIQYVDKTKSVYVGELNGVNNRQGTGTYKLYDADGNTMQNIHAVWNNNEVDPKGRPDKVQSELTPLTPQPSELPQSTQTHKINVPLLPPPPKSTAKTRSPLVVDLND